MNTLENCPHLLFVYGTLKPGFGNNHVITDHGHVDLGPCRTVGAYLLNNGFPYVWYPLWAQDKYAGHVVGHLYSVDDAGLAACDRLEGHPWHYCRTDIRVAQMIEPDNWIEQTASIYLAQSRPGPNLQLPRNGLLEWGRDEPQLARDFQRRR